MVPRHPARLRPALRLPVQARRGPLAWLVKLGPCRTYFGRDQPRICTLPRHTRFVERSVWGGSGSWQLTSMNDNQLRVALKRKLNARYLNDPETRIIDELGIRHGTARVDIAVVNGALHGFELKSDRDTLNRLPHQSSIYSSVLDRVTLVVGRRHIEKAMPLVPEWWGVHLAHIGPRGGVRFSCVRRARNNPAPDPVASSRRCRYGKLS